MFGAKQVQTLDVDKIMDRILENYDAKVAVDKLTVILNKQLEDKLVNLNDDAEIKEYAQKGYSWKYRNIFDDIHISGELLAEIIGYKVKPEDEGTFQIIQDKYEQFKKDFEQEKEDEA